MKKTYSKPQIVFESFSLSTNIAGDCGIKIETQSLDMCGMDYGFMGRVFLSGMGDCAGFPVAADDGSFNQICYHVPIDSRALFNS